MLWYVMLLELNIVWLMVGVGLVLMFVVVVGWQMFLVVLDVQVVELIVCLNFLGEVWIGGGSDKVFVVVMLMVVWL